MFGEKAFLKLGPISSTLMVTFCEKRHLSSDLNFLAFSEICVKIYFRHTLLYSKRFYYTLIKKDGYL